MLRIAILTSLLLFSCIGQTNQPSGLYQVDIILFTHQHTPNALDAHTSIPVTAPNTHQAIPLQSGNTGSIKPYHLLSNNASQLNQAYWALSRKPEYQVLAHYTWLQPSNNQHAIALPITHHAGWDLEGTLRIRQSNYYLLDTHLLFSSSSNPQSAFLFTQKQRLKPGTTYYLDHPQAGMLIKVHKIA